MSDYLTHQLAKDRQRELMSQVQTSADARQARKDRRAARRSRRQP
jgi:hypothetical protein